jgi:stage IV sporulation protein FB
VLTFSLLGVPVRIHYSFALIALLAYGQLQGIEIVAWTVAAFLAVVAHEAGHAFTARAFGAPSVTITLFALGGVTTYPVTTEMSPGKRFLISAAGSTVGVVLGGAFWLARSAGWFDGVSDFLWVAIGSFIYVALVWGILNWLPILPLDGGHMVMSLLEIVTPQRALPIAKGVSIVAGAAAAVAAVVVLDSVFLAGFVAFITIAGLQTGSAPRTSRRARPSTTTTVPPGEEPPEFPI